MNGPEDVVASSRAVRKVGTAVAVLLVALSATWWFQHFRGVESPQRWLMLAASITCFGGLRELQRRGRFGIGKWSEDPLGLVFLTAVVLGVIRLEVDESVVGALGVGVVTTLVPDALRGLRGGRLVVVAAVLAVVSTSFGGSVLRGIGLITAIVLVALLRARSAAAASQFARSEPPRSTDASPRTLARLCSFGALCVALALVLDHGTRVAIEVAHRADDAKPQDASKDALDEAADALRREALTRSAGERISNRIEPEILPSEPSGLAGGIHRFQVEVTTADDRPLTGGDAFLLTDFHPPAPWQRWTQRDADVVQRLGTTVGGVVFASFEDEPADDDVVVRIDGDPVELSAGVGGRPRVDVLVPRLSPAVSVSIEASTGDVGSLVRLGCGDLVLQPGSSGANRFVVRVPARVFRHASYGPARDRRDLAPLRTRATSPQDLEPAPRFDGDDVLFAAAAPVLATAGSDLERVEAITEWLAHGTFRYDFDATVPGLAGVAVLARERRGKCLQFATAALVLLRRAGLPARLAVGHLVHDYDEERGVYDVWSRDAHAFVEVHFERAGWVPFDATPPAPRDEAGQGPDPSTLADEREDPAAATPARGPLQWVIDHVLVPIGLPFAVLFALVGAVIVGIVFARRLLVGRRVRSQGGAQDLVRSVDQLLLQRWLASFSAMGASIRRSQTLQEFAASVASVFGARVAPLLRFVPWFERSRFGGRALDPAERQEVASACDSFRPK